jgi:hypothetical protein
MRITQIAILKNDTVYKKILDELKIKGLNNVYIQRTDKIDYLDMVVAIIDFLEINKKILKKIKQEQYENIIVLCIYEIFQGIQIDIEEEQIEKVLKLLKNSLLTQKLIKYLFEIFKRSKTFLFSKCCK